MVIESKPTEGYVARRNRVRALTDPLTFEPAAPAELNELGRGVLGADRPELPVPTEGS